jgi:hypothetical protein
MNSPFSCYFLDLGITFKDVLHFEERNQNGFFFNSEGNLRQYPKKKIGDIKT